MSQLLATLLQPIENVLCVNIDPWTKFPNNGHLPRYCEDALPWNDTDTYSYE